MSRIHTPASIEVAPGAAQPLLQAAKRQLGTVPNLFRLVANSPAAIDFPAVQPTVRVAA